MISLRIAVSALSVVCCFASRTGLAHKALAMFNQKRSGQKPPAGPGGAPAPSPAAAPKGAPGGADPCQCSFEDMCTCKTALAHLDCISKTCASTECDCPAVQFSQSCGQISSVCKPMLDITCTPDQALCDGKFYQLSASTLGISIDLEKLDKDAHCGPTGKCEGDINVNVAVVNREGNNSLHLECFLEEAPGSKSKFTCSSEISGNSANCKLPMPKELPAGDKLEGWCRIVDRADDGKSLSDRLTHDAPFYIYNHNKAIEPEAAPAVKLAEAPPPKRKKAEPKSGALSIQGNAAFLMAAAAAALQL